MKYRKKPIVIEAFMFGFDKQPDWFTEAEAKGILRFNYDDKARAINYVEIETLEGRMRANYYDYIIKGVKGELYPCKPDIFEASYEPVPPHVSEGEK